MTTYRAFKSVLFIRIIYPSTIVSHAAYYKCKCMILNPTDKTKTVSQSFPHFTIDGHCLQFVNEFRYLEHIITNSLPDDADIKREIHNMYVRTLYYTKVIVFVVVTVVVSIN